MAQETPEIKINLNGLLFSNATESPPNGKKKLRGRPKTTLPIVFNRDLALIQHPIRPHSSKGLASITELAQNKKCWRRLTSQIDKAAEVSQTKNWDATRQ